MPKAELHSHIGGLLLPEELIEVALKARSYKPDFEKQDSVNFYDNIQKILCDFYRSLHCFSVLLPTFYNTQKLPHSSNDNQKFQALHPDIADI